MKFGSVCSGIEAASVAWNSLGWDAEWFAEIEPFPSAVLAHHYPDVPNLGDMTLLPEKILNGEIEAPDILCGGTPCQAFSVAGNRQSLDDARGNLTLTFCEIADAIDSRRDKQAIIFWENVPGVLNTKDNAFGCFLARLAGEDSELKPSGKRWTNAGVVFGHKRTVAWRVLDAQYFGLAQRRKRVFVVASAREGFDPAKVLFEFEGLRRDIAPSRGERKNATSSIERGTASGKPIFPTIMANCGDKQWLAKREGEPNRFIEEMTPTMRSEMGDNQLAVAMACDTYNGTIQGNVTTTMTADMAGPTHSGPKVIQQMAVASIVAPTLTASNDPSRSPQSTEVTNQVYSVYQSCMAVRRLTPKECERLQGFPDDYTKIPYRNKSADNCPDSPRYKALGNSWAVPVVRWIGERIARELEQ